MSIQYNTLGLLRHLNKLERLSLSHFQARQMFIEEIGTYPSEAQFGALLTNVILARIKTCQDETL